MIKNLALSTMTGNYTKLHIMLCVATVVIVNVFPNCIICDKEVCESIAIICRSFLALLLLFWRLVYIV